MTIEYLLAIRSAYLTGSRALGVVGANSDYEIIMDYRYFKQHIPAYERSLVDIANYFYMRPINGKVTLLRNVVLADGKIVDIIVTYPDKDGNNPTYDTLVEVTHILATLPIEIRRDRNLLIDCFHKLLAARNWEVSPAHKD